MESLEKLQEDLERLDPKSMESMGLLLGKILIETRSLRIELQEAKEVTCALFQLINEEILKED